MEIAQVIVLIIGAVLFTVSFFIPDKKVNSKEIREKEERIFKELVEKEMPDIQRKIDEVLEDSMESARENTKRQLERLTNEKMIAINEYSDTVMSDIHKNHEEAVFLYDMLNNKHAQVKTTTAELNQAVKQSKQVQSASKNNPVTKEERKQKKPADTAVQKEAESRKDSFEPVQLTENLEVIDIRPDDAKSATAQSVTQSVTQGGAQDTTQNTIQPENNVEVMFATDSNETNSNDRILEMHRAGKSNMAIARELGLGIGEVKLVIDLFEGGM